MVFNFDGLYGQDSYEYYRYTERLAAFLKGGAFPGDLVWPKGYLFICAFTSFILPTALAGQLISITCLYLSFLFLYKTARVLYKDSSFLLIYLALSFLLSPYILRLSAVMMADTLAILCLSACAYYSISYQRQAKFGQLLALTIWASLGAFSRYAVIVPIVPFVIWAIILWFKQRRWSQLCLLVIPALFLIVHLYFEGNGSDFLSHHFIDHWNIANWFKREFVGATDPQLPTANYILPNLLYYSLGFFHPGFFFLLPFLLIFLLKNRSFTQFPSVLWISILSYSLFLAGITFQGSRYLSLSYPLLVLLFFPAFADLMKRTKKWKNFVLMAITCMQILLFYRAMQPSYQMNQFEQYTAEVLHKYEGQTLYSFEVDISLQQRGLQFNYLNLWAREYEEFESGALIVFNEKRFANQYEGKNLMNNWIKVQALHELVEISDLNQGWKLYRIND